MYFQYFQLDLSLANKRGERPALFLVSLPESSPSRSADTLHFPKRLKSFQDRTCNEAYEEFCNWVLNSQCLHFPQSLIFD